MLILNLSAVLSPTRRLYFRLKVLDDVFVILLPDRPIG